jgi:hypothetical protein
VTEEPSGPLRKLGIALLIVWAVVFLAGAAGELLQIDGLRKATDFKRIFLR